MELDLREIESYRGDYSQNHQPLTKTDIAGLVMIFVVLAVLAWGHHATAIIN